MGSTEGNRNVWRILVGRHEGEIGKPYEENTKLQRSHTFKHIV
jgi:hypothetical protein